MAIKGYNGLWQKMIFKRIYFWHSLGNQSINMSKNYADTLLQAKACITKTNSFDNFPKLLLRVPKAIFSAINLRRNQLMNRLHQLPDDKAR